LWVRCLARRTANAIDLRTLDRHRDAAVTSLIPALSCRSCRPNAPFAELVRLSRTSGKPRLLSADLLGVKFSDGRHSIERREMPLTRMAPGRGWGQDMARGHRV
jgi:hypothetical protein